MQMAAPFHQAELKRDDLGADAIDHLERSSFKEAASSTTPKIFLS